MLANTSIKFRLMTVMVILSLLMMGIGAYGLYGFNTANKGLMAVYYDRMVPSQQLGAMLDTWYKIRESANVAVESRNTVTAGRMRENISNLIKKDEVAWAGFMTTYLTPEEAVLAKTKSERQAQYIDSMQRSLQLVSAGSFEAAEQNLTTDTIPKFDLLQSAVLALLDLQGRIAEQIFENSQSSYDMAFVILMAVMAVGVLLATISGILLVNSIVKPLDEAIEIAHKVASGDLTSNIVVTSTRSSTGRLMQALKEMNDHLIDLVGKVRLSADKIAGASGEIAAGNLDLSHRTEQQASNLEQAAASMEELTSTIKLN